ncbi:MAG: methionyl-tRNA formyltransferase [Syntrophobacteraceae bacterium]
MEEKAEGGQGIDTLLPGLVFLGTPEFAVPSLRGLVDAGAPVRLVVTQPDRPSGRGRKLSQPPVKILANELGIPVYQPERIRGAEIIEKIKSFGVDCAVVVAFGQILPQAFLDVFALGALNVHASLLPRHRGAAPIHRAILAGDAFTGISIMLLDAGMDTGPVLSQREISIGGEDIFETVHDRLSRVGAQLLVETLTAWAAGTIEPRVQDDSLATYAPPVKKEELRIDWNLPAKDIINRIRAFDPGPGAYFMFEGKRIKCFRARSFPWTGVGGPGEVGGISESGIIVTGGDRRALSICELQMEGRPRMETSQFVRGRPMPAGSFLE